MTIAFMALAAFFTWFSFKRREILITFVTSMLWFALAMWLFFGDAPLFDIEETYIQILVWVFVMMTFVPWLAQMNTEIENEAKGQRWKSYGQPPKGETTSKAEEYRKTLRRRRR